MTHTALTHGIHHLGLTVSHLQHAKAFFVDALGFRVVGEKPDYPAVFVSDGQVMMTLWQVREPDKAAPFDRERVVGLHHVALTLAPGLTLEAAFQKVREAPGVTVEFGPEPLGGGPVRHFMCIVPGGVRVEILAAPSPDAAP